MKDYLEASKDAFLNSFISFSNSNDALRARVPAALLPFSICNACIRHKSFVQFFDFSN